MKPKSDPIDIVKYEPEKGLEDDFLHNDIKKPFLHSPKGPVLIKPGDYIVTYDNGFREAISLQEIENHSASVHLNMLIELLNVKRG